MITKDTFNAIKVIAEKEGKNVAEWINEILLSYILINSPAMKKPVDPLIRSGIFEADVYRR